jgi:hypothetical protein
MKLKLSCAALFAVLTVQREAFAFVGKTPRQSLRQPFLTRNIAIQSRTLSLHLSSAAETPARKEGSIIEGAPSKKFRSLDARKALSGPGFFDLQGNPKKMEDLLPSGDDKVSVVVLMRSWG